MPDSRLTVALSPSFPAAYQGLVEAASPRVRVVRLPGAGPLPAQSAEAEVLAWWDDDRAMLARLAAALPKLRWVQSPVAGVGDQRLHEVLPPGVLVTSAAGVFADGVAEHVLMLMLALYRRLPALLVEQAHGRWSNLPTRTLQGDTLGIVGSGGIGRAAARLARAFGMTAIGLRRGAGEVPELDRTLPREALPELLAAADVVLIAAPLTPETRGQVDEAFLRAMRPTAFLINIARGGLVVTAALLRALEEGWIAGAGLDVTDPEPLPADHPLWHAPGVIITPHQANPERSGTDRPVRRLCENLRRALAGEPLLAVVDPGRGY